ncbi:MAG: stage II sporulation protein D [Candidatus Pseudoruminococcus sp.]|uniref:stage II sporulation protein D n=1 Tax=Candidatus Pseudoruminococcus sp. TaxID=3101048 RepID=UPI002A7E6C95|nr:stage II sporulation protein D [Ruminococcus sp.]MDY2782603.1 stage II sporulation protein D [Candidatus Pseudoruminococcus sp.]
MKIKREFLICTAIFVLMASLPLFAIGASYGVDKSANTDMSAVSSDVKSSKPENKAEKTSSKAESKKAESKATSSVSESSQESHVEVSNGDKISADGKFKILDTSTNEVLTLTDEEFLIGAVAAEMPPSYETEALKAQCVATYTCYAKKRADERDNPHEELNGADFSADLSKKQVYLTPDRMKEDCGENYEEIYSKYKGVVECVKGEVLTYKGELITCTYFAISSGKTDSFKDIFGKDLPYLTAVSSPYDAFAPNYKSEKNISEEDFKKAFEKSSDKVDFSEKADKWISNIKLTDSGSVKSIKIGGIEFSGSKVREILGLRSACFSIKYDNEFQFEVKGYGHNVGMSQYGANEMAKEGIGYKGILEHYYKVKL